MKLKEEMKKHNKFDLKSDIDDDTFLNEDPLLKDKVKNNMKDNKK